ncbi:MAG: arsenite methyltransferase [Candidatus Eiseniibacteriota bacterium]
MNETQKSQDTLATTCCGPDCCGGADSKSEKVSLAEPGTSRAKLEPGADIHAVVRERYGAIASGDSGAAGCCGGPSCAEEVLHDVGYFADQARAIPEGANLGLGCGNPLAWAKPRAGETVLDLGSGAGIDCFLAAHEVGPTGHVIGVDMTPTMIDRARANAKKGDYAHVEFRLGEIEHLPVADASVDVVISNCVVNLSPEKGRVFAEAHRVLKPGGRMVVSDLVWTRPLPDSIRRDVDLLVGCIAGASLRDDYLALIREAGFRDVEIVHQGAYTVGANSLPEGSEERAAFESVASIKVLAHR